MDRSAVTVPASGRPSSVRDGGLELVPQLLARQTEVLQQILAELRGLRQDEQRPRTISLSRQDRALLVRLLPAIAGAKGSEDFTVADLFELAAVRVVIEARPPAHVGRLLKRAIGVPIDGYVVTRETEYELHRRLWRVLATTV